LISTDNVGEDFKVRLKRVECNFNLRNIEQQEADLEILNQIALGLNNRHMLAQVYNRRAYLAATLSDHKRVVDFGLQAKREANVAGDDDILLDVNLVVANALVHLGNIEEAMMFAQEGLDLARNMGDGNAQARSLTAMGLVALEARGPAAAYQYQSEALALVDRKSGGILVAKILVNLAGAVGLAEGDYQAANDYFEQAMKIYSEYGDLSNKGHVMANLGWVAGILGDFPKAMDYYEQALVISRQLSSQIDTMFTYVNLSSTASARGLSSNAIEWAQAALEISLKLEDAIGEAWAHYAMGVAELSQSNFREGIPAFMKSLEIRLRLNAGALIHETRAGLVNAYLEAGDVDAAKEQAELILQYMEINPAFEGAEEPLRVHLALFNYLNERKDSRIQQVLRNAKTLLDTQVSNLRLEQARARFVENVPWRRGISEAIQQNDFE
jgi:tetratricopeptide (TPR) repeat protein